MPSLLGRNRRRRSIESDEEGDASRESTPQSTSRNDSKRARRTLLNEDSISSPEVQTPSPSHPRSKTSIRDGKRVRPHSGAEPDFQPGSIVRVKLTNFVTYTSAEFLPGPNLNMVIGPNGTGKSTLVCAICLGLGWGPQHLGRAKDVSEFVKHGCQEATIEIELAADPKRFRRNPVVTRTIKREGNKSFFTINGKQTGKNGVLDLARSFSIQIDNLCQFLPQDKVVEFAAMTPIELLQSTQQAAGSSNMLETHENLKKLRAEQKQLLSHGKGDKELLSNLQNRQEMAKDAVERFKQRTHVKERVGWLERCRPITLYKEAKTVSEAARAKKKLLHDELKVLRKEVDPILRSANSKQEYLLKLRQAVHQRTQSYQAVDRQAEATVTKIEACTDKVKHLEHNWDAEVRGGKAKKEEQKRYQHAIRNLRREMENEPEPFDFPEVNTQIRERVQGIRALKDKLGDIRAQTDELKLSAHRKQIELQQVEQDTEKLETSTGQQEIQLQRKSRETHKAWKWIQDNQDKFEKQVFGPPMVECTLKDPKYADAVESLLQNTDFLFFTVQTRNDFRTLQDQVNGQMRLGDISIRVSTTSLDQFRPQMSEAQLRQLGFEGFALDFLNGPEPVLAVLCSEKRLHQNPIGFNDISDEQYRQIEQTGISSWVAGSHSYQITRRREYGDAGISSRVRSIRKASVWTTQQVDAGERRALAMKKAELQDGVQSIKDQLSELSPAFNEARDKAKELEAERSQLQDEKDRRQKALTEFKSLPTKLAQVEGKLNTVNEVLDGVRERLLAIDDEKNEVLMKKAELAVQYVALIQKAREAYTALLNVEILHLEAKSDHETLVARNQDVQNLVRTKEDEEKQAIEDHLRATDKAKKMLTDVHQLIREGESNERFQEFIKEISQEMTTEQLEANIDSCKAQLDLTHEGDAGIVKQYEDREKQIADISSRMEANQTTLDDVQAGITELRSHWEPELDALVAKISEAFSDSFARIGCAGQVSIFKASSSDEVEENGERPRDAEEGESTGNGLDFGNWAIHVYVKFRESEPLSLLDSHRQSGGERAVSTIFYLMALQSLSRAPFRVVDEINQGMDPRNERMVHGRMVDIACGNEGEDSGSQYFLITPKLLSGLKYKRGMKVLCIVSGEQMPSPERIEAPGGIGKVDFKAWIQRAQKLGLPDRRVDSGLGLGVSQTAEVGA